MVETRIEPLAYMLLNGLVDLAFEAWNELESEHADVPYNPDWEAYQRKETDNCLRFFALRDGKDLIGYASIILDTDIHRTGILFAQLRDIFIAQGKRGYAPFFVKNIEKALCSIGVKRIYAAQRINSPETVSQFYAAMGFQMQECLWGKTIH